MIKIYQVYPEADFPPDYQPAIRAHLAEIIVCLKPIYEELRDQVSGVDRLSEVARATCGSASGGRGWFPARGQCHKSRLPSSLSQDQNRCG